MQDPAGEDYRIPPGRQQIVLGALLLEVNRTVSLDGLIEATWETDPPATARTQVQICVSRLRGRLAAADGGEHIVTRGPGYALLAGDDEVDARSFQRLVAESDALTGEGRLAESEQVLGAALALWRGPALAGLSSRGLEAGIAHLDEQRMLAIEAHVELGLRLGRHQQLVGELTDLVARHPLREQLRARLMLALYRSGRQAEALETYREGRDLLVEQLGLDPGEELCRLEAAILAGDPALNLDAARPVTTLPPARPALPPAAGPFQLPTDIADFSGRAELLADVDRLLRAAAGNRATPVVVLAGKPGVGKTAFAVHLAHRLAEGEYADGQLYVDLGGTRRHPATAMEVLGRFLRALGVAADAVPRTLDERAALYRQLLANRRVLVLLDDADSDGQVRALLPGTASCLVLVTSRVRLTGLAGADVLDVEVLDTGQALQMLTTVIGADRVAAEPAAVEALIRLVGGLPLALRIVAARLAARPRWSLAWMLGRLTDERRRLDELEHGELMVRASVAMTYDGLEGDARRLLRLLSVLDTPTLPAWVGPALLGADPRTGADLLERLLDAQMLEFSSLDLDGSPRYRFHELIRLFAREQLEQLETPADRQAALGRVASGWLGLAAEAHRRIYGGDFTVLHGPAPRRPPPADYSDRVLTDPLAWLEAEHDNLCSVVRTTAEAGLDEWSWDLAGILVALFEARCSYEDWESTHESALAAVRAAGNARGEAAVLCSLGSMHLSRGRPEQAAGPLARALETFTALGDELGLAPDPPQPGPAGRRPGRPGRGPRRPRPRPGRLPGGRGPGRGGVRAGAAGPGRAGRREPAGGPGPAGAGAGDLPAYRGGTGRGAAALPAQRAADAPGPARRGRGHPVRPAGPRPGRARPGRRGADPAPARRGDHPARPARRGRAAAGPGAGRAGPDRRRRRHRPGRARSGRRAEVHARPVAQRHGVSAGRGGPGTIAATEGLARIRVPPRGGPSLTGPTLGTGGITGLSLRGRGRVIPAGPARRCPGDRTPTDASPDSATRHPVGRRSRRRLRRRKLSCSRCSVIFSGPGAPPAVPPSGSWPTCPR